MYFAEKREGIPSPFSDSALAEAVAAGAVIAIARVAHMNGGKLTMHSVAVILAVRNAAGNAAIDIVHVPFPPFHAQVYANFTKISETALTNTIDPCKII